MSGPEGITCFVQDATGARFLFTIAGAEYEPRFRKHAREWIAAKRRPGSHRDKGPQPIFPVQIVVESRAANTLVD